MQRTIKLYQWIKQKAKLTFGRKGNHTYGNNNDNNQATGASSSKASTTLFQHPTNPYIAARLEWNYLFGDIMKAKYHWQWTAVLSLLANLLLISGMIVLSLQSRFIPYAVKVDQLGNALYAGFLDQHKTITALEVNAFLRQYLVNARSVILDSFAQKRAIDSVYAVSLPPVRKLLDSYYKEQNPFQLAKQEGVEVEIQGVIQKSTKTWQIDWVEVHRNSDGQILSQTHFEALVTVGHYSVKNPALLNTNPLGLYIQRLSWAQQS